MRANRLRRGFWLGLAAAFLVGLVLALQYGGSIYAVQLTRISKEKDLERHLHDLGNLARASLRGAALGLDALALDCLWEAQERRQGRQPFPAIVATYRAGLGSDLTRPVLEFARRARLRQALVLSPEGRVLFDSQSHEPLLETYDFWKVDREEVADALHGKDASTPAYAAGDASFKRHYVPILDASFGAPSAKGGAKVGAIVCLVAGRSYLAELGSLSRHLERASIFVTILMALIALLIQRLITRQRRAERQAAENDRLAAIGRLAAGFAHELRNPLGIIRAFTEDMKHDLERARGRGSSVASEAAAEVATKAATEACDEIVEEVDRMNRLVGQFLSYSKGQALGPGGGQASALEAVESVLAMTRPSAEKKQAALRVQHAPASREEALGWRVRLETGSLRQVLMNLVLNAIEASPPGAQARVTLEAQPRRLRFQVIDQGPGIGQEDRLRVFEPFYTTRDGGTGLGLAISRQIAESAGGSLEVGAAPPGGGACLVLTLPRAVQAGHQVGQNASQAATASSEASSFAVDLDGPGSLQRQAR
jgi:signal transduction histidine kinase